MEVKTITGKKFDTVLKSVKLVNNTMLVRAYKTPDELKTVSGILIKSNPEDIRLIVGEVVAVGPGITDWQGKHVEMNIKEGDKVVIDKYNNSKLDMTALLNMLGVDVKDDNGRPITYYHVIETSIIMAFDKDVEIPEEFYFGRFVNNDNNNTITKIETAIQQQK